MKLYFAGAQAPHFREVIEKIGEKDVLMSFHAVGKKGGMEFIEETWKMGYNIFMDSGAYSSDKINIDNYEIFLQAMGSMTVVAASLDILSWENQQKNYKRLATNPKIKTHILNVYHIYEREVGKLKELDEIFESTDYFAIGGVAGVNRSDEYKLKFLDYVFSRWEHYRKQGKVVKIHGFGITDYQYCLRYPFYSVDSTSWLSGAQYGVMNIWDSNKHVFGRAHHTEHLKLKKYWKEIPTIVRDMSLLSEKFAPPGTPGLYKNRLVVSAQAFANFRDYCTKIWEARGIVW